MIPLQHLGPVCALKVYTDELLFAGEGPSLTLYNYKTGEKVLSRIVLTKNKIHGIELLSDKIVVWGARSLTVFTLNQYYDKSFTFPIMSVSDWIFHSIFENETTLHVLNSHNIVYTIDLSDFQHPQIVKTRDCKWKSILYSGSLHNNPETGKITVLAGTVMNGILIWDLDSCKVKHNLTLHEGSIFKVIASPDGKYIVSCSDDRSIKVWDMESGELLANGWGHGSRIWGLSVYGVTDAKFNVFSSSEDCTARIWTFNKNQTELKQERIILGHTGRHVWSCDVNDKLKLGFTGGADGKIMVSDLDETSREGYWGNKWELKDIASECQLSFKKGELVKDYVDFGSGLLAVTSEGNVVLLKDHKSWSTLFVDSRFEKFSVLKAFDNDPVCVLGNKLGDIVVMRFNDKCELVQKVEFSVADVFNRLGNILVHEYNGRKFLLLESPNPSDPLLYMEIDSESLAAQNTFSLNKPTEKITVSSIEYDTHKGYLLIGCRFATLLVYKLGTTQIVDPLVIYTHLFKGDTISSIKPLNLKNESVFYFTNKDGTFHLMKIFDNLTYQFLHSSRIQKGFLEGLIKLPNGDILLYGFKSDSFFIWNETKQYEIMREICGGPHRRWYFKHWINKQTGTFRYRFIYSRALDVQIVQKGEPCAVDILSVGLHGREIRDICVVDSLINPNEKVVIAGAEDTTLKIGTLRSNGDFELHWTYREHVGGLQSIHAVNNEYIVSSSAREELFVWKISECDQKKCMSLQAFLPPSERNPDLRIMDFDSIQVYNVSGDLIGFLLVSVYSNSVIRIVYYDYQTKKFNVVVNDAYMTCCIFHTKFVKLDGKIYVLIGSTNGHVSIYEVENMINEYFEVSDDSLIKRLNTEIKSPLTLGKLLINQQIHQSSIKAMEYIVNSGKQITLITGGDDNALIKCKLEVQDSTLTLDVISFDPNAASSTITTISKIDTNTVLVGAVDQSVKLWNIENNLLTQERKYSTVADIGCSEISQFPNGKKLALIGGAGFSVWEV
ncbi:hypothetical protein CANINC_005060 [Pichia inconspicua]|uniref:Uncharacterized protein n=1 Tax=Pichia inconspicua TaxID=52247 RepID=A0A4T0WUE7_9ASCO|nr:hypothetical protein CANINC_005060 [[Candida] inconspicua]